MKTSLPVFSAFRLLLYFFLPLCRVAEAAPGTPTLPSLVPSLPSFTVWDGGTQGFGVPLVFHAVVPGDPGAQVPSQMSADYVATVNGTTVGSGRFSLSSFHNESIGGATLTYRQVTSASSVFVTCSNLVNLASGGGVVYYTFTPRTLTVSGGTAMEGNAVIVVPFTASIEKAIDEDLSFSYISSGGTATAGLDYTPVNGTAIIPKGQTSVVINVPLKNDNVPEQDETLGLEISGINLTVLRGSETTGTIKDEDTPPPPGPAPVATTVTEMSSGVATTQAWFAVDIPAARTEVVRCRVSTRDGTATAGEDFRRLDRAELIFPAGRTRLWVAITVMATPRLENTEYFYLDVEDSATYKISSATCTIERFAVTSITELQGGGFQLRFPTGLGQRYFVEAADAPGGAWELSSAVINGTGLPLDQRVYPTQSRRFFRVREHTALAPGTPDLNH